MTIPSLTQPVLIRHNCPRCGSIGAYLRDNEPHCLSCGYEYAPTYANTACAGTTYIPTSLRKTKQRQFPITARCDTCLKRAGVQDGVLIRHDYPKTPQSVARVNTQAAMEIAGG